MGTKSTLILNPLHDDGDEVISEMTTPQENKARILIVDDNADKRLALASVLDGLGEHVVEAESGRDALRLLLNNEFAVILLDVKMPEMGGYETAALIRTRKQSQSTPIIFVTAYNRVETDMLEGYSLGAVDYIFAPIIPEILRAKVAVFVELYHKTQEVKRYGQELESLVALRTAALTAEIAERRQTQERLHYLAHHDALTDMPNRVLFVERLKQALARAQGRKHVVAVLFIDLDRFKLVNDTLGHEAGDQLLRTVAANLLSCIRDGDAVARFGGDEFAVFLNDVSTFEDVPPLAQKFLDALAAPFNLEGTEFFVTSSIGISLFPSDGSDTQTLMKNADTAMYRAKQQGGNNFQFYKADMNSQSRKQLETNNLLRQALQKDEFVLHYQPQFDLKDGAIVGVEALIHWAPAGLTVVPPEEFIPLLEENGLIVPVGEWVLRTACAEHHRWCQAGSPAIRIAVNASARQLNEGDLLGAIARIIEECPLLPGQLEIEITETVLLQNMPLAIERLKVLASMGVGVAMDDFGTGYSSLGYLRQLPIDVLKIDEIFIRDINNNPADAAIAQAIITMAHSMNMKVVAEGVKSREQVDLLRAQGCDFAQGFYFSLPLPSNEIERLLREHYCFDMAEAIIS
jgi:diguanylate cyclase (GGDEF)-like protein